jgi:cell fate (sporulation/competence/biofilm development) regulator YlbF (YheA/YmcA/DUF963 family)
MHEQMLEKATELGRILGQTSEYKALGKARERLTENRALLEKLDNLAKLETQIARSLQRGEEPAEELQDEYEKNFGELQTTAEYQSVVAAQTNFEKLLSAVNDQITKGIEAGAQSRIIMPS